MKRLETGDWDGQGEARSDNDEPHSPNLQSPSSQAHSPPISLPHTICARYGILAVGWVVDAPILALRFAQLPDLLTFLALRAEVWQEVGETVEVLPVEALAPEQVVAWLEEAA